MIFYRAKLIVEQKQCHRVRTDTAVLCLEHTVLSPPLIFSEGQNLSLAILLSSSFHAII